MRNITRNAQGFSLIELMIVIAIIGALTAVSIPAYYNHISRSRQAEAAQTLLQIKNSQERYYSINDSYADAIEKLDGFSTVSGTPAYYYGTGNYYRFSISAATTTTYTAKAEGDLNKDTAWTDCWQISEDDREPSECGTSNEGFSFSLIGQIF